MTTNTFASHGFTERTVIVKVSKELEEAIDGYYGGDCERKSLGAEPCIDCPFCDEKGNL